jgi:hypothetical protein
VRESGTVHGASLSREAGRLDFRGATQTGVPATSLTDITEARLALHARREYGSGPLEPENGPALHLTVPVTCRLGPASALRLDTRVERIDLGRSAGAIVTRGGRLACAHRAHSSPKRVPTERAASTSG